ncbi:MAG: hypothetical protein ACOCXU_02535 [Coleofasciculus sp.]
MANREIESQFFHAIALFLQVVRSLLICKRFGRTSAIGRTSVRPYGFFSVFVGQISSINLGKNW